MNTPDIAPHSIEINQITHFYTSKEFLGKPLFDPVTASFRQGNSYGIKGSSGAGKTTLLHIIGGLVKPAQGTICTSPQLRTAMVFQQPILIDELSVIQNIMAGAVWSEVPVKEHEPYAHYLLEALGLEHYAQRRARSLSIGQQQRVCLARALIARPHFLLADEPTASLDPESAYKLYEVLTFIQKEYSIGLIVGSHDPVLLAKLDTIVNITPFKL